jgi:HD domain
VRVLYRVRQFRRTLFAKTDPVELERALPWLSPAQAALFLQLQPGERDHAVVMLRKLIAQGSTQPDLLVAALLHDVGKLRYRLNPLERALVVLVSAVSPGVARDWGRLPPGGWEATPGWRKPFVLAEQHAQWGAEMASGVGVSSLTETLIREHQHARVQGAGKVENELLRRLWIADNES